MLPDLTPWPLAALLGGVFVGVGVGLIVQQGGSSGGDDALALVIHKLTGWRLSRAYLFTDLTVLLRRCPTFRSGASPIRWSRSRCRRCSSTTSRDFRTKTNVKNRRNACTHGNFAV